MENKKLDGYDIATRIICFLLLIMALIGGYFGGRAYVADWFVIPTSSMEPTLIPGDWIIVNKLVVGARIYDEFDFGKGVPMKSHRTKGFRSVEHNDIVIFNFPVNRKEKKIEFELNYVYGKRCIGLPGDFVSIVDSYYKNNNFDGELGDKSQQQLLKQSSETTIHVGTFNPKPTLGWTIKDYGPLYVPRKGDTITLTPQNYILYEYVVEFESGKEISLIDDGVLLLGDSEVSSYTFERNYYFMAGDNVLNSRDSRYWGFVPEEFIIGVATRIIFSKDRNTGEFRWNRLMKSLKKR